MLILVEGKSDIELAKALLGKRRIKEYKCEGGEGQRHLTPLLHHWRNERKGKVRVLVCGGKKRLDATAAYILKYDYPTPKKPLVIVRDSDQKGGFALEELLEEMGLKGRWVDLGKLSRVGKLKPQKGVEIYCYKNKKASVALIVVHPENRLSKPPPAACGGLSKLGS